MNGGGRRRALRRLVGALPPVVAVALVLAPLAGSAGAAATECAWQRHSKRVVKHLKRHGEVAKVVRTRHYWTCNPVPAPEASVPPAVAPTPAPVPAPPSGPAPEPEANAVGVIADDHGGVLSYTRTKETARAGPVTIDFTNRGEDEHNLNLVAESPGGTPEGETIGGIGDTEANGYGSEAFVLPPGRYLMFCSIGHHAEHGMKATLVVE